MWKSRACSTACPPEVERLRRSMMYEPLDGQHRGAPRTMAKHCATLPQTCFTIGSNTSIATHARRLACGETSILPCTHTSISRSMGEWQTAHRGVLPATKRRRHWAGAGARALAAAAFAAPSASPPSSSAPGPATSSAAALQPSTQHSSQTREPLPFVSQLCSPRPSCGSAHMRTFTGGCRASCLCILPVSLIGLLSWPSHSERITLGEKPRGSKERGQTDLCALRSF